MQVITDIHEWQKIRKNLQNKTIGLVPTMGCLHVGHASLISRSTQENDITLLSIFVNPTQFNNPEDFKKYPNTFERDLELAQKLNVDYVLAPNEKDLYPEGNCISVKTNHPFSEILEGKFRPGHFNGVLTIVLKLLLLAQANKAYFGEKDYQQFILIQGLVKNYFVETEIIRMPTVREKSGLACSSRNERLSENGRKIADQFAQYFLNSQGNIGHIKNALRTLDLEIEYLEQHENRIFAAVYVDGVRLIDNRPV